MNRVSTLPGECRNLSDTVHILALEGQPHRPPMTLAEAQKLATDHRADLMHIQRGREPMFVLVDAEMWSHIGKLDHQQMVSEFFETPPA